MVVFVGCISVGILSEVGRAVRLPWFSVNQKMRYSPAFHIINSQSFLPTILNLQHVLQKITETLRKTQRTQAFTALTSFANSAYLVYSAHFQTYAYSAYFACFVCFAYFAYFAYFTHFA